jgi:hypothetical protein
MYTIVFSDSAANAAAAGAGRVPAGPLLPLDLPRLEHICTSCFPACVGDKCLLSIEVTYPKVSLRCAAVLCVTSFGMRSVAGSGSGTHLTAALQVGLLPSTSRTSSSAVVYTATGLLLELQ